MDRPYLTESYCDPRFERVRTEFESNFAERDEHGAAVCVTVGGETVVDLWGGVADERSGKPWEQDTMAVVQSCSKGLTAICAHILIDRGELDIDAPVAKYWPEFAQHGKQDITVLQILSHQSGVAHVKGDVRPGGFNDWELMIRLIEETPPYWEPGTRVGYHGMSYGWLVGEVVRRVSGKTVGTFLREEVVEPLGADCWMGLPAEHEARVATCIPWDMPAATGMNPKAFDAFTNRANRGHKLIAGALRVAPLRRALSKAAIKRMQADPSAPQLPAPFVAGMLDPRSAVFSMMTNMGGWMEGFDAREAHAAEIPAGGAITNARGLATIYRPLALGGEYDGVRLVSEDAIPRMAIARAASDRDACMGGPSVFTLGFHKSLRNQAEGSAVAMGEDGFGHAGRGGSLGMADPAYGMSFGYCMTRHGLGTGLNERGQSLLDAVYESLGSPGKSGGAWRRPVSQASNAS